METLGASEQVKASWKPPINLRLKEVRSHLNMDELNSKGLSGKDPEKKLLQGRGGCLLLPLEE